MRRGRATSRKRSGLLSCKLQAENNPDNRDQNSQHDKLEYAVLPCSTIDVQFARCHLNLPTLRAPPQRLIARALLSQGASGTALKDSRGPSVPGFKLVSIDKGTLHPPDPGPLSKCARPPSPSPGSAVSFFMCRPAIPHGAERLLCSF